MKHIKDKIIFENPLIIDGVKVFNPSESLLFADGYKRYITSEVDMAKLVICDCEPDYEETEDEIRLVYRYTFSKEKAQKHYCQLAQNRMDEKARERNYDNIASVCTYSTSGNPKFAAEAAACVHWRDAVWSKCYELLESVLSGGMGIPTEQEFYAMLPVMKWPDEVYFEGGK